MLLFLGCFSSATHIHWVVLTNSRFSIKHLESHSVVIYSQRKVPYVFCAVVEYFIFLILLYFLVSSFEVKDLSVPI